MYKKLILNLLVLFLRCIGYKEIRSGTLLTQWELRKVCIGISFRFVAHPLGKPNYYVFCTPGEAKEMTCDSGECFDKDAIGIPCSKKACNSPTDVDPDTIQHCSDINTKPFDTVHKEDDCTVFYACTALGPKLVHCPPKQYYSVEQKMCINNTESTCTPFSKLCEKARHRGLFPLKNCKMYYKCTTGKTRIEKCPIGYKFVDTDCVPGFCN